MHSESHSETEHNCNDLPKVKKYENTELSEKVLNSELCLPAQKVENIMRQTLSKILLEDLTKERSSRLNSVNPTSNISQKRKKHSSLTKSSSFLQKPKCEFQ